MALETFLLTFRKAFGNLLSLPLVIFRGRFWFVGIEGFHWHSRFRKGSRVRSSGLKLLFYLNS